MASTSVTFDIIAKDKASRAFSDVGNAADHSSSKMAKFGAVMAKGAVAFAAVGTAAAVAAFKVGSTYVASLNQIQALTGANNNQMDKAAKALEANSGAYAKMGQTVGDAASGVVELTKSGLSLNHALHAITGTMTLAKAGEMSVADASSVTANALNTFHLKAKAAGDVANYLANAANISSADVSDLAESLKYVSPVAAAAGVSIQQTNAVLAELANAGIKGSSAGTAFRTFLLSLEAPSTAASKVIADLGINVYDATGKLKPLGDVIQQVGGKLGGLSQAEKNADLKAIFGKVGIAGATTILNEGKNGLAQYTQGVEKAGAATALAESRSKGLAGTLNIIKASAISAAQSFYRQVSPGIDAMLKSALAFAGNARTDLAPLLSQVANRARDLASSFQTNAVPALKNLASKSADNLHPALDALKTAFEKNKPAIDRFTHSINDAKGPVAQLAGGVVNLATKIMGRSAPAIQHLGGPVIGVVIRYFANWIQTIGQLAGALNWIGHALDVAGGALARFGEAFNRSEIKVEAWARALPGKIKGAVGDLGSTLWNAGVDLIKGFIGGIGSMFGAVKSKLGSLTHSLTSWKGPPATDRMILHHAGVLIMEGLVNGIGSGFVKVKTALEKVTGYIKAQGAKLKNLMGKKSDFTKGFQSFTTSVFSTDLSRTSTDENGNDVTTPASIADMIAYQRQQANKAQQLAGDVGKLHQMGLSDSLIRQLQGAGESGMAQIHTLAGGSQSDIDQLNQLNAQTQGSLNDAGIVAARQLYNDDIAHVKNNEDIAQRIADKLKAAMKEAGKNEFAVVTIDGATIITAIRKEKRHQGQVSTV